MTFLVKRQKHRHRVVFKRRAMAGPDPSSSASRSVGESLHGDAQHRQPYLAGPSSLVGEEFVLNSPNLLPCQQKQLVQAWFPTSSHLCRTSGTYSTRNHHRFRKERFKNASLSYLGWNQELYTMTMEFHIWRGNATFSSYIRA